MAQNPKKSVRTTRLHIEQAIEHVVVKGDLVAYRLTTTTVRPKHVPRVTVSEGFTSSRGIRAYEGGAAALPPYRKDRHPVLGTPELRDALRTSGWLEDGLYEKFRVITDPYARFLAGTAKAEDVLFVDGSCHMVYDAEGLPLPVAIPFNYIEAHMHDGCYDLEKALAILKKRTDVRFVKENRWAEPGTVESIPYYNRDSSHSDCLSFVWMPTVEDYRRMVAQCAEYGGSYPTAEKYRAVFELDLLGLRAGGAAKVEDFYQNVNVESDDEGEDEDEDDRSSYDDEDTWN